MRRVCFDEFGEPARVLRLAPARAPAPGAGMVRLRMCMAPVHPADLAMVRGRYVRPARWPAVPGLEGVGIVEALGAGVTRWRVGARAAVAGARGLWAEQAVVPAARLLRIPDALPDTLACQLFVNPLTAVGLLESVRRPGVILQTAAGSAVGRLVAQLAARAGRPLINLVRSAATARDLQRHGTAEVICTGAPRWAARVRRAAGDRPIVACLDPIAGPDALALLELLAPGGELILYGGLAGAPVPIGAMQLASRDLAVRGFWLSPWLDGRSQRRRAQLLHGAARMLADGSLRIPIAGVFPLPQWRAAVQAAESPGRNGKILLDLRS